jgi:probable F420-dependent oxidoreductase
MVSLAAIAGATRRIRLATGILIAPLRNAPLLAKQIATLDHLSGSRLDIGLGAGWHEPELRAAGIDPADRLAVLEETIFACRALWSPGPASFGGAHVRFDNLNCVPKPRAGAALPLWLAGPATAKGIDRVARLAQGWLPLGNVPPEKIAEGRDLLRAAELRYGLAEGAIGIRASLGEADGGSMDDRLDRTFAGARALVEAGATQLQLPLWRLIGDAGETGAAVAGARARIDAL